MRRTTLTTVMIAAGLLIQPATHAQQAAKPAPSPAKPAAAAPAQPAGAVAQPPAIVQAMQEEMKRAMDGLRLKNEPAPYFIAYGVEDLTLTRIQTRLGTVVSENTDRSRIFMVEVRVGDYTFDSSRFMSLDRDPGELASYGSYGLTVSLDEDSYVMRRQIWLATDAAYKRALQALSRKKALAQSRTADPDPIPDFSRQVAADRVVGGAAPVPGARVWIEPLKKVSGVFAAYPNISTSGVSLIEASGTRYLLTSDGIKVVEPSAQVSVSLVATTQAADGAPISDGFTVVGRTVADLPPAADLEARATRVAAGLTAARTLPVGDDYSGPVLVDGEAAAAIVAQSLMPLFRSQRAPEADGMMASIGRQTPPSFLSRIGSRVLAESLSISDTPSLRTFNGAIVPGAYAIDDEGVPAQDVKLVQDGKVLTLLTSRTPQKGLPASNGHARYGGAQAGVFQVESSSPVSTAELKAKYLQMLKEQNRPFGYIVRAVAGGGDPLSIASMVDDPSNLAALVAGISGAGGGQGPGIARAVKVLPDGTEQPVRGLNFGVIQQMAFRLIPEASRERVLMNVRGTGGGLGILGGAMPMRAVPPFVSVIAPSLIFEELEIQRAKDTRQKPPLVPPPGKK